MWNTLGEKLQGMAKGLKNKQGLIEWNDTVAEDR